MTFHELKRLIASLEPEQQDRLAAFLSLLRHCRNPEHRRVLSRRLDDPDPDHWLSLDQVRERLRPAS